MLPGCLSLPSSEVFCTTSPPSFFLSRTSGCSSDFSGVSLGSLSYVIFASFFLTSFSKVLSVSFSISGSSTFAPGPVTSNSTVLSFSVSGIVSPMVVKIRGIYL